MRLKPKLGPAEMRRRTSRYLEALTPPERKHLIPADLRAENVPEKRERKPSRKLEAPILKAILQLCQAHPKVAFAYRQNAGTYGENYIRLGPRGIGDIVGMMKDGRYLSIEVKAPGKQAEEHQLEFMYRVRNNGGLAGWATSVNEALKILEG